MNASVTDASAPSNPYDEVPYGSQAFAQTHPDRLATMARIFGLTPAPIAHCRVLELGCASGGNLLPMACAMPESEFVGVDLSARQVAEAQTAITTLGLTNASVHHASIEDIDASWGRFDYIICHGVFSWVERAVQDNIFEICASCLADNGVAYVSYNTYPGWHMRESVRHMMRYHATPFDAPTERIEQARAMLDFLANAVPPEASAYGRMLSGEVEVLRHAADWYVYHEHLEPTNTPMYFHQFAERAEGFGLQYLAEADFATMLASRFPEQVAATLERISADVIHLEQYMDFVTNRHFRQTLLCKAGQVPKRALSPAVLHGMHLAAPVQAHAPEEATPDPSANRTFRVTRRGQVTTQHPLSQAALTLLGERWPRGWPLEELIAAATERAAPWADAAHARTDLATLMEDLFKCFVSGLIDLGTWQPPCVTEVSERPRASAWAAFCAPTTGRVTTARHAVVALEGFSQALLPLLDGQRDLAALEAAMLDQMAQGTVSFESPPPAEPQARLAFVGDRVREALASLARHGLLTG